MQSTLAANRGGTWRMVMLVQNVTPALGLEQLDKSAGLPLVSTESLTVKKEIKQVDEAEGSIRSHLLFGLGAMLFVSPMLIPGIPMKWLAAGYVGLLGVAIIAAICWAGFDAISARMLRNQRRRKRS